MITMSVEQAIARIVTAGWTREHAIDAIAEMDPPIVLPDVNAAMDRLELEVGTPGRPSTVVSTTATPHDMWDALTAVIGPENLPGPGICASGTWNDRGCYIETRHVVCLEIASLLREKGHEVEVSTGSGRCVRPNKELSD